MPVIRLTGQVIGVFQNNIIPDRQFSQGFQQGRLVHAGPYRKDAVLEGADRNDCPFSGSGMDFEDGSRADISGCFRISFQLKMIIMPQILQQGFPGIIDSREGIRFCRLTDRRKMNGLYFCRELGSRLIRRPSLS